MCGGTGFTAGGDHLIEGAAFGKMGVELAAEFTRAAGASIEAMYDGWINMFHGEEAPDEVSKRFVRL